jgi:hypothetical protein
MPDKVHRIDNLEIDVRIEDIAHSLGYTSEGMPLRVSEILDEVRREIFIEPRCAYRYMGERELSSSAYLRGIEEAALCLVTIGPRLEAAAEKAKEAGDLGRSLIIDSYGSAAAEALADSAEKVIKDECARRGLKCSRRFSPGYSGWDVSEQRWIIPALEADRIGVVLTEGCMMVPRKSITFAVVVGENPREMRKVENTCDVCGLRNCRFRRKRYEHDESQTKA